ncbi:hypothetical protein [Aurantiacibacter aquimixticola]|uniref:Uncharacterized protein n=1 Tax=Aurantiacibacter aquimixticola TaxID=1958945 RepID=A0A419RTJ7_9SPHN|nr:hypothetical protein [Aurantiacibacter aquimixticola]RJY09111.1 hypothetical protein D6201_06820 [Aurantiacibacter aquimixticola]
MQRLQIALTPHRQRAQQVLDVPNIGTALIVADINLGHGTAQIMDGENVLATLDKQGSDTAPFWLVR